MSRVICTPCCWPMREVYDMMCELGNMPFIRNFDRFDKSSGEIPEWIRVLRTAFEKFECMQRYLPYEKTCNFGITDNTTPQLLDAILSFSTDIFRCQAFFPGQTPLCKHALVAWQHLNIICMHCRTYQMHIFIRQNIGASQIPSEDSTNQATRTSAAALLVVTQSNHATERDEREEAVVTGVIVRPQAQNPYVDTTDAPPVYHKDRTPTVPTEYDWDKDNKAKLEVRGLLQQLQNGAY